jgi:hypothetical protein
MDTGRTVIYIDGEVALTDVVNAGVPLSDGGSLMLGGKQVIIFVKCI